MKVEKVVELSDIDFKKRANKVKYIQPDEKNNIKYNILQEALNRTNYALIVKHTPRTRQGLWAIWSDGNGLTATRISFREDIKTQEPIEGDYPEDKVEKVVKLLEKQKFNTEHKQLENRQRNELEEAIMKKAMGEELNIIKKEEEKQSSSLDEEIENSLKVTSDE